MDQRPQSAAGLDLVPAPGAGLEVTPHLGALAGLEFTIDKCVEQHTDAGAGRRGHRRTSPRLALSACRARVSRDLTVPTAMSRAWAISS